VGFEAKNQQTFFVHLAVESCANVAAFAVMILPLLL
jgi:hypothetical protein